MVSEDKCYSEDESYPEYKNFNPSKYSETLNGYPTEYITEYCGETYHLLDHDINDYRITDNDVGKNGRSSNYNDDSLDDVSISNHDSTFFGSDYTTDDSSLSTTNSDECNCRKKPAAIFAYEGDDYLLNVELDTLNGRDNILEILCQHINKLHEIKISTIKAETKLLSMKNKYLETKKKHSKKHK